MECFSELLKMYIVEEEFDYHPKRREIDLVNLSFADDLFILCGATELSLKLIRKALRMFGYLSGLHLNSSKSCCYFAGLSQADEQKLFSILDITASVLPVKYLDIPLTTKQLGGQDYRVLVDKIKHKIEGWGSKHLSYAGRVVLISSVIFGVCNYWCQTVFLPISTIKEIEKIMKACLWKGTSEDKFLPKVSWKQATLRKEEGGLGIKSIQSWNITCMAKHL
ncbi:reverse transcriptase [Lithospermum erythrorhizon]|uniref:Reverse transcriptase n=1 Tax=Lithospermum erythrorhizon TaxID=34254 RepID=A0AAV3NHT8_LITER